MADYTEDPHCKIDSGYQKQQPPGSRTEANSLMTRHRSGTITPFGSSFGASIGGPSQTIVRTSIVAPGTQEREEEDDAQLGQSATANQKVMGTTPRKRRTEKRRNKRERRQLSSFTRATNGESSQAGFDSQKILVGQVQELNGGANTQREAKQPGSDDEKVIIDQKEEDQTYLVEIQQIGMEASLRLNQGSQEINLDGFKGRNTTVNQDQHEFGTTADEKTQIFKDSDPERKNQVGLYGQSIQKENINYSVIDPDHHQVTKIIEKAEFDQQQTFVTKIDLQKPVNSKLTDENTIVSAQEQIDPPTSIHQSKNQMVSTQKYQQQDLQSLKVLEKTSIHKEVQSDKSQANLNQNRNTFNSIDELIISSLSESETKLLTQQKKRPSEPEPINVSSNEQPNCSIPTFDGLENFDQSDEDDENKYQNRCREPNFSEQKVNVNLQMYSKNQNNIVNSRKGQFCNDINQEYQQIKIHVIPNRNYIENKFKFTDESEDQSSYLQQKDQNLQDNKQAINGNSANEEYFYNYECSNDCGCNDAGNIHTIEEIDEKFEVESQPCQYAASRKYLNKDQANVKISQISRLSPQNNLVLKQSVSTGPTDQIQSEIIKGSSQTKQHSRKGSQGYQQVNYFQFNELDQLTDKNDPIPQDSSIEAFKNQSNYQHMLKQLQMFQKYFQNSQNLYFQPQIQSFDPELNDISDSNFIQESSEAYIRECLREYNMHDVHIQNLINQSPEAKISMDKKHCFPYQPNEFQNVPEVNEQVQENANKGPYKGIPGPFKSKCMTAMAPVQLPPGHDSTINMSNLLQNPQSEKSLEINQINLEYKQSRVQETQNQRQTSINQQQSIHLQSEPNKQPLTPLNHSNNFKSSSSNSYIVVNNSTNTQKHNGIPMKMLLSGAIGGKDTGKTAGEGVIGYAASSLIPSVEKVQPLQGSVAAKGLVKHKKKITQESPNMLGRFKLLEQNESDDKTEITQLNNLNIEMHSILQSQQSVKSFNSQFKPIEKTSSNQVQASNIDKNKKLKNTYQDQTKSSTKNIKLIEPTQMQPHKAQKLNPKKLEQSVTIDFTIDDTMNSIDGLAVEKMPHIKHAGEMTQAQSFHQNKHINVQALQQTQKTVCSSGTSHLTIIPKLNMDKLNQEFLQSDRIRTDRSGPSQPELYRNSHEDGQIINFAKTFQTLNGIKEEANNRIIQSCNVSRHHQNKSGDFTNHNLGQNVPIDCNLKISKNLTSRDLKNKSGKIIEYQPEIAQNMIDKDKKPRLITKAKFDEKIKEVINHSTIKKKTGKPSSGFFSNDIQKVKVRTEPPSPEARDNQDEASGKPNYRKLDPKTKPTYVELLKMNQKLLNAAARDQDRNIKKTKLKKPRKTSLLYKSQRKSTRENDNVIIKDKDSDPLTDNQVNQFRKLEKLRQQLNQYQLEGFNSNTSNRICDSLTGSRSPSPKQVNLQVDNQKAAQVIDSQKIKSTTVEKGKYANSNIPNRLATPSTPLNCTESKLDQPGITGDASSTKSFYEKLSELLSPEAMTGKLQHQAEQMNQERFDPIACEKDQNEYDDNFPVCNRRSRAPKLPY